MTDTPVNNDPATDSFGLRPFDHHVVPDRPFVSFLRYIAPYKTEYLVGAGFALLFIVLNLIMPRIWGRIVDKLDAEALTFGRLTLLFLLLVGLAGVSGGIRYLQRMLMIRASRKFEYDIRNDYYRHVHRLPRRFFHRMRTGDVMARATNDLNYVRLFAGPGVMGSIDMLVIPAVVVSMFFLDPGLTLVGLIPLPLVSVLVYLFVMYMHKQSKKVQELFGGVTSRAQENLAGARVVKAYGAGERELEAFEEDARAYMKESVSLALVAGLGWPVIGMVMGGAVLLVLWRGGVMHIRDEMSLGDLTAFLAYMMMVTWPLARLGWILTIYQRGAAGMRRIGEVMGEEPAIRDSAETRTDVTRIEGRFEFQNVSFSYDGAPALHALDFVVEAGSTVALVGPTGSGKSTVVSLLTREYDATSGQVLVDGVDIRRVPLRVLRDAIGYVPQDAFLFSDTVGANLAFGRPDATREEMDRACEAAQFMETVESLPDGYDTLLGERGVNLSGGQKQRLTIARAVLRDPNVLILDDALSAVDTHTEERILQRLQGIMAERTSVIISHRVSTIRHADEILVIDEGRIVERGRHDELVEAGGMYADMYRRQLLEDELEER